MTDYWPDYLNALADPDQPRTAFAALQVIAEATVGTTLFTAMTQDPAAGVSLRVYSQNEAAYPTGSTKPLPTGAWADRVIHARQPFAALTIEEIAAVFPDHALIASLGCGSACNVPVVVGGAVIGTINLLHETGWYTPDRVEAATRLHPFAVAAFLMAPAGAGQSQGTS